MSITDPVVVGVDGSDDSLHAARWAAELAARNGCDLVVVHSWSIPFLGVGRGPDSGRPARDDALAVAERTLQEGIDAAREHRGTVDVTGRLAMTTPTVALKVHSGSASVVVIGSHGFGKVGSFMLGSVGVDLAGHTFCPLVVVRGAIDSLGPVVVGIDDSPRATAALFFAFHEAAARGVELHAVHSWSLPAIMPDWPGGIAELLHEQEKQARDAVESTVDAFREAFPEVTVKCFTPSGSAGRNLVDASVGAQLVVVGARGRGGFRGLVLGSTSHSLIHHAECPVAVVPHRADLEAGEDGDGSEEGDLTA